MAEQSEPPPRHTLRVDQMFLNWKRRRSDHYGDQAACCCCGCGHVGNARALSEHGAVSTALPPRVPVTPPRQTTIGVRLSNA
jgi:hypothetical protein